jgi:hypothetical protein
MPTRFTAYAKQTRDEDDGAHEVPPPKHSPANAAAELVACTKCQKKLKIPAHLIGKKVKCVGCGASFVA